MSSQLVSLDLPIEGFNVIDDLSTSVGKRIVRCLRLEDKRQVILKMPNTENPTDNEIACFENEFRLLKKYSLPGVIKAYDLIQPKLIPMLLLEDFQGAPLKTFLRGRPLELEMFFTIALQLVDIIDALHRRNIIHKDIKPSNILINSNTLEIKLIDLSISSQLTHEIEERDSSEFIEGGLNYISPEQTGRMNLPIDERTDFYSLGVTFFEMLTGELPFESENPLEIVYGHIAKTPPFVSDLNQNIPKIVALLIAKLMAKIPDHRYSQSYTLKLDLQNCETQWQNNHVISPFELGKEDVSDRLRPIYKLYGREKEINQLETVFEEVGTSESQLVIISGYAGIGKTFLVKEIQKLITQKKGNFISGKFDQLHQTPYSAFIEAFHVLIKRTLLEPEAKLNQLKKELITALGKNAGVLTSVIPDLKLILGQQSESINLKPIEAQNRFMLIFQRFVSVFARPESPLVVFLDDLQWADNASLKLIENLLSDRTVRHLLIMGAHRKVESSHLLNETMNHLLSLNVPILSLTIEPLKKADIQNLLADTFNCSVSKVEAFSELLITKTQGNPFFINEFLKELERKKLIRFSYRHKKWRWDLDKIANQNITDNVADLLVAQMQKLSPSSQQTLALAACIGFKFDLETISVIRKQTISESAEQIETILKTNLIMPLQGYYRTSALTKKTLAPKQSPEKLYYHFMHDKVQQAAYSLIKEDERQRVHLEIGRALLKTHPLKEGDQQLFDTLSHINQALSLTEPSERNDLAVYNLWAGKKAKSAMAYQSALSFLGNGISLLNIKSWRNHYSLTHSLFQEQLDCLYLLGDFKQADEAFDFLMQKTQTTLEKSTISLIKINAYATIEKHQEAIEIAAQALAMLNFHLPTRVGPLRILKEITLIYYHTRGRKGVDLFKDLKEVTDPKKVAITRIIHNILPATYLYDLNFYAYISCRLLNMSITEGYIDETPTAYLAYAIILIGKFNKIPQAAGFVEVCKLIEKEKPSPQVYARNRFLMAGFIQHWYEHAAQTIPYYQESFQKSLEVGNLEYAGYSKLNDFVLYFIGRPIVEILKNIETSLTFYKQINNFGFYRHTKLLELILKFYQGAEVRSKEFEVLLSEIENDFPAQRADSYFNMSEFLFIIGDYEHSLEFSKRFYRLRDHVVAYLGSARGMFFYALTLAKSYEKVNRLQKFLILRKLKKIKKYLKNLTMHCPSNYKFMFLFLSAEINYIKGKYLVAAEYYDAALSATEESGFTHYVAFICEAIAEFYLSWNRKMCAKPYLQKAFYTYQRWGSKYKCHVLAERHPWLLSASISTTVSSKAFDEKSLIISSQALSSEINLDTLIQKLMQVAIQNAGAQRAALFFEQERQLIVVAKAESEQSIKININGSTLSTNKDLPHSILTYVHRTNENVLLSNENDFEKFQNDSYLKNTDVKSLLCAPILRQGRAIAYIYLENRLTSNAFTPERLKILNILGSQAAISLENAKLYTATGRFVPLEFLSQINRQNIAEVKLGDQLEREMSILFCDIRNFTTLSEQLAPADVFKLINHFLEDMNPVIKNHHGFVDKYIGDAIMALFYRADDSVKAATNMLKALENFNQVEKQKGNETIKIGIGINTGRVILGIVGDQKRIQGTVIGDAVNIASRVQDLTKQKDTELLISDDTKQKLSPGIFDLQLVDEVKIRGKKNPIKIWTIKKYTTFK